ncbi:hypothetical protein [Pelagicoccus sp. SDUM812005]|uniref:hypothetical protein n=1 Tax=Pelagicoccus sp. SDUM812005 TaxID=3041257 RepID=UPI0028113366|nr:hypothetical protein [Pelagicoccus sp. SDUM812005]
MAEFRADETFTLKARNQFYVCGEITEGKIKAGDILLLPCNSDLSMEGKISSIEMMDRIEKKEAKVALGIEYESDEEKEMWEMMNIGDGEILKIKETK